MRNAANRQFRSNVAVDRHSHLKVCSRTLTFTIKSNMTAAANPVTQLGAVVREKRKA